MRKVILNMKENNTYEIIKDLCDNKISFDRAKVKLGKSSKQIKRYIKGYKEHGKEFFIHGNRGRKPSKTIPKELSDEIVTLYLNKYSGANFVHFKELLEELEDIIISITPLRNLLMQNGILSPKAHKKTIKASKKAKKIQSNDTSKSDTINNLSDDTLDFWEAHPRRERCKYAGELIQMDASLHVWFGEEKYTLHAAIDDATGKIVGAYFCKEETLDGYYIITKQIILNYGIPNQILTDKRTVFTYKRKDSKLSDSAYTQYGYACKQLGITLDSTSVAQAKGRIERLFETLQSRLITELKIRNITTLEEANKYLVDEFIDKFNKRFSIDITKNVYVVQESESNLNLILARIDTRIFDNGSSIKYKNKYYIPTNENEEKIFFSKGAKCLVIEAFDKILYTSINDKVYLLKEIARNKETSKNFDFEVKVEKPAKKKYIPPMTHPWRVAAWVQYVEYEKERLKYFKDKEIEYV